MTDTRSVSMSTVVKYCAGGCLTVLTLLVSLYGIDTYLDGKVAKAINDKEFLMAVAARVRPAIIIDGKGSILADMGGMQYIASITIVNRDAEGLPSQIDVLPKIHLAQPPILRSLDSMYFSIRPERGEGLLWTYRLSVNIQDTCVKARDCRFQLEVLP